MTYQKGPRWQNGLAKPLQDKKKSHYKENYILDFYCLHLPLAVRLRLEPVPLVGYAPSGAELPASSRSNTAINSPQPHLISPAAVPQARCNRSSHFPRLLGQVRPRTPGRCGLICRVEHAACVSCPAPHFQLPRRCAFCA